MLYSIIGWNSVIGDWTRIEGTPNDPNPNKPFTKLEAIPTFTNDGKLNPSITVIGKKTCTAFSNSGFRYFLNLTKKDIDPGHLAIGTLSPFPKS